MQQADEFDEFASRVAEKSGLAKEGEAKYVVEIGEEDWPIPVPIVKDGDGWRFDTKAGVGELLARRVGANELTTVPTLEAVARAMVEYNPDQSWGLVVD